jgi:2-iminobutanoate/2-iminopropanoate deaminase
MPTYVFGIDTVTIQNQKADNDHSDNDWLTLTWTVANPITKSVQTFKKRCVSAVCCTAAMSSMARSRPIQSRGGSCSGRMALVLEMPGIVLWAVRRRLPSRWSARRDRQLQLRWFFIFCLVFLPDWAKDTRQRVKIRVRSKEKRMSPQVETSTPAHTPTPIGPYNHIAKVGQFISIGGTAGVDPVTGVLAGPDVYVQTKQILQSFKIMLESVDSDLNHVVHVNIFLKDMQDFDRMNQAYSELMGDHRPARTVIGVHELPKPGVLLTMNLTAVTRGTS